MRGYPKYIATNIDIENLLSMPEYASKAKEYLTSIALLDDGVISVDTGTESKPSIKQVANPLPMWKKLGYKNRAALIAACDSELEKS